MTKTIELVLRVTFLFAYVTSLLLPLQGVQAGVPPASPAAGAFLGAVGELDASWLGGTAATANSFAGDSKTAHLDPMLLNLRGANPYGGLFSGMYSAPASTYVFQGGLEIEPIAAYNLIVDSNVLSPSSYGPNSATLGAKFCNRSGGTMNDVWAYIGDRVANTPGQYPVHNPTTDSNFDADFPHLGGTNYPPTQVDYGDPARFYALEHEAGTTTDVQDASRYLGTLANGECRTVYWLVSYPRKAYIGSGWVDVTGGVKPEDDLWLQYDFWGKVGANTSYYTRYVTMRNEISAMANKIWPNGDNKVPDEYVAAIQQVLGWDTWTPNGSGTTVYPGETLISQGIWFDLGNVGAGFDNNYDLVPDRNIWVQPIGDAGSYDPGCFRLVKTYGLMIVKLNDGTELLIPFVDQMYFENIPDNNIGAVGLVFYEYIALDGICTAGLTPYQEVASGYDNEKFNADFGAGIPPLQSKDSNITLDKTGQASIGLTGTINYSATFTLPDLNPDPANTMTVTVGSPSTGMPLSFYDAVPIGLQYAANSASTTVDMSANYLPGDIPATLLHSKDGGATWISGDPGTYTSTSSSDQLILRWQLQNPVTSPASGAAVTGTVSFNAVVPGGYTAQTVSNTACLKIGSGPCFTEDTHNTLISGTSRIEGTAWRDDATGGGVLGNGLIDEAGAGIGDGADADATGVTVSLYWDANGDGDSADAGDFLYTTTTTDSSGNYAFTSLPATGGSARYLVVVDTGDGDLPTGYGPTTPTSYKNINLAGGATYGDAADGSEPSDFGFAPALSLIKNMGTTGTIYVNGDAITYTIAVTNNLPGSGTGSSTCSYTVWTSVVHPTTGATPPGGGPANAQFQQTNNIIGPPDEVYSYSVMSDNTDVVGLSGFNTGNLGGNITSVQYVISLHEKRNLSASDRFFVNTWYNDTQEESVEYFGNGNWEVDNVAQTPGTIFSGGTGTEYIITRTLDPGKITNRVAPNNVWRWTDFTNNLMELQLEANKGTNNGEVDVDAAGFIITTDGTCGGSNSVLNPVPLADTFDDSYFDFISADPPVSSSGTGTLTWNNVGPLYPGQTKIITVLMRGTQVGTSPATINTATSTGSKFASGLPANSPVSDTAEVTITNNPFTRSISGRVFDDNNTNGWQTALWTAGNAVTGYDTGDTGLQYIPVDLYGCVLVGTTTLVTTEGTNKTCAEQGGEWRFMRTTSSDSNGDYSFGALATGYYRVSVDSGVISGSQTADVNQNGTCTTCDSQSNAETDFLSAATFIGDLETDTALTRINFGYNVPSGAFDIGDLLFYDWDGDGTQDAEDEPLSGVTVRLLGADGTPIATDVTGSDGIYGFDNYASAYYTVQVLAGTLPTGLVQSRDPDSALDGRNTFSLTTDDLTKDFAYKPNGSGTIGDTVFRDVNGNGTQDGTETGISGVTVELQVDLNGDGTYVTVKTAVTDSSGRYLFSGLPAGSYRVKIDLDNSPYANSTALPNDPFGNDYRPSNGTTSTAGMVYQTRTLATNTSSDLTADFGFAPPASFGDTVYQDINGNGTQDLNEPGINGVTITLYNYTDANNNGRYDVGETIGASVASTTTAHDAASNLDGIYRFTGLAPGNYVVQVTPPSGATLTGDPSTDGFSCLDLANPADPGEPSSLVCDHREGMRMYPGTNYTGADFGYQLSGAFGDTVWIDTNGNSRVDSGEAGIPNITVTAVTVNNVTVNGVSYPAGTTLTTATDANGNYSFQNIVPVGGNASWTVTVNTADPDFPASMTNTYDPDGSNNSSTSVIVDTNGVVTSVGGCATTPNGCDGDADPLKLDADFGYRFNGPTTLSGTICLETSADGVCGDSTTDPSGVGSGESAYATVTVYLYKLFDTDSDGILDPGESTVLVATTSTNANGDFSFASIPDGTYYIIAIGTPQDGLSLTSTQATVNTGGDGAETTQYKETLAGDGDTLSAFQVVNIAGGDTSVTDRDFAFELNGSYDFGDLPQSYSTTLEGTPDGPRHLIPASPSLYFGPSGATQASLVDSNGQPTVNATGDGSDENGVMVPTTAAENSDGWTDGTGTLQFDIVGSGWLTGWIDYNRDGDFADAGEMVISRAVSSGVDQNLDITTPTSALTDGYLYARFRLFAGQPSIPALAYSGAASIGEVEDYRFDVSGGVTTPVTLSYFRAQRRGASVDFEWSTSTETGNAGFNLYVEEKGQLVQINSQLIPSSVTDSLDRRDYTYSLYVAGMVFYIEDVSVLGETRLHGPFKLGQKHGNRQREEKIDQFGIELEHRAAFDQLQKEIKREMLVPAAALQIPVTGSADLQLTATLNLKVRQTGLYRVTYEQLKTAGLDLKNVPVAKITLTNRGRSVPINVYGTRGKFGPNASIEFYGEALDTTYTDTNVYTLQIQRSPASRVQVQRASPGRGQTAPTAYAETLVVDRQRAYANYAPALDTWYDTSMLVYKTSKSWSFPFEINGMANSSAELELVVWGVTDWPQSPDHHLVVGLNGVRIADETFNGLVEKKMTIKLPAGTLREGANTLVLTLPGDTGVNFDLVNLDRFSVTYPRFFQARDGRLTFTATGKVFNVTNLPSRNVIVYRLDEKGLARLDKFQVKAVGTTFTATFAGTGREATYLVSTAEAVYLPVLEGTRKPANLDQPARYLVISHPDFIDGLEPLLQARRAQGLSVNVVDVYDLYARYAGGVFDPQAIRDYIKHAAANLGTEYVLLVGGDTYDYRNYTGRGSISFIPSLYFKTGLTANFVPVDPLYTDLNGDDLPDLAIGRFPVRTQSELQMLIEKTLDYAGKDYGRTAVFASDKFDGSVYYKDASLGMSSALPLDWTVENIHLDDLSLAAAQSRLIAAMNRGTSLVTFTGHSGPSSWTFSSLFNTSHAQSLTNAGRPFVVVQWGCWNTYYVDPVNNYLVQSFLFSGDRGAAAVLGASTLTESHSELLLGESLTPRMVRPGMTLGQALQESKTELAQSHPELLDVLLGWTLIGDPALVIEP